MTRYFYLDANNQQQGPIEPTQFPMYGVNADTLVWCNTMSDWATAGSIPELASYVLPAPSAATPPPYKADPSASAQPQGASQGINVNVNQGPNYIPCPDTYLVWAILSTLFCCLPTGIVSIVYSCQVNSKYASGDYQGAMEASASAKKWALAGLIVSLICGVLYGIFLFVMMGVGITSAM